MKDPDIIEFPKGFAGKPPQQTEGEKKREWLKNKYPGLFNYENNQPEDKKNPLNY